LSCSCTSDLAITSFCWLPPDSSITFTSLLIARTLSSSLQRVPTSFARALDTALDGTQFIGRLLQHVLPAGFKRIRHYGLRAQAAKAQRLARARQLLAMPVPNPQKRDEAQAFMRRVAATEINRCLHCKTGHWLTQQVLAPLAGAQPTGLTRPVPRAPVTAAGKSTHRPSPRPWAAGARASDSAVAAQPHPPTTKAQVRAPAARPNDDNTAQRPRSQRICIAKPGV